VAAHPIGLYGTPIATRTLVAKRGDDGLKALTASLIIVCLEDPQTVFASRLALLCPNHRGLAILPGDDDQPMLVPREQRGLGSDPEVLVNAANRLSAAAEGIEKPDELVGAHPNSIIGYGAPMDAAAFDGLPLDTEFDPSSLRLESVDKGLAHPLEGAALAIRAFNNVVGSRHLHWQDVRLTEHVSPLFQELEALEGSLGGPSAA